MAKNVFGVLNTAEKIDGADFIVRKNPPEVLDKLDQIGGEGATIAAQGNPSRRWALLRTLLLTMGVFFLTSGILNANSAGKLSFLGVFQTSPILMAVAVVSLVLAVVMMVVERKRMKKAGQSEALAEWKTRSKEAEAEAFDALKVPQDAILIDLLTATYALKNGVPRNLTYTAFDFRAWIENGCLCLADVENVVALPLDQIRGISELPGKTNFYFWNKKESPDSEPYRQYQIRKTYFGAYSIKGVRAAHIRSEFGEYELLVPPYELETFLQLTGKAIRSGADTKE